MIKPDFKQYTLKLLKDTYTIYTSDKPGLRPLYDCITKYKGEFNGCILHDKIIGVAAARLILYSDMISEIHTKICSMGAKQILMDAGIMVKAEEVVDVILNNNKSSQCPMEAKALAMDNNQRFYAHMKNLFSYP